jgi:hypothetical protein
MSPAAPPNVSASTVENTKTPGSAATLRYQPRGGISPPTRQQEQGDDRMEMPTADILRRPVTTAGP